jgi:hypothetical protein
MAFIGGDLISISYKHPTLGSGTWYPKSAEDGNVDNGGYNSTDEANGITGAGQMITTINRKRWMVEVTVGWDMANTDEVAKAGLLAGSPVDADWIFEHINGTVWGGKGRPVGDLQGSTDKATTKMKIAGGGELKQL